VRPLLVSHSAERGGAATVLLGLLRHRPPDVEPACVFLADGPARAAVAALGVPTALLDAGRARELWRAPRVVRVLRGAIRAHRADVVFAHVSKAHLYASPAAWLEGLPYLWWQHATPRPRDAMEQVARRLPAAVVICSSDLAAASQRALGPGARVVRIHPGLDAPGAAEPALRTGLRVGMLSRLQRLKRIELVLAAVPAVVDAVPGARFEIAGGASAAFDADYPAELQARVRALSIADAVRFAGEVDDGSAFVRQLDVLVHAASAESFGLVYVEAMLAGVPVVAPDRGGGTEVVRDGIDGVLVDVEDPSALAGAIVGLLRDDERRARLGAAARMRAEREFTAARMAQETWSLVRSLAPGPTARPRG
jgi:glycosyltransferase involved in cell wall biosynthesis